MDLKNFSYLNIKNKKKYFGKIKSSQRHRKTAVGGFIFVIFLLLVVYFLFNSWVPGGYYLQSLGYSSIEITRFSSKQINKKNIISQEEETNLENNLKNLGLSLTDDYYKLLFPKTEFLNHEDQMTVCFVADDKISLIDKKNELDAWAGLVLKIYNPQKQDFILSDNTKINQLMPAGNKQLIQSRSYQKNDYLFLEVNGRQLIYGIVKNCAIVSNSEEIYQEIISKSQDQPRKSVIKAKLIALKDVF